MTYVPVSSIEEAQKTIKIWTELKEDDQKRIEFYQGELARLEAEAKKIKAEDIVPGARFIRDFDSAVKTVIAFDKSFSLMGIDGYEFAMDPDFHTHIPHKQTAEVVAEFLIEFGYTKA